MLIKSIYVIFFSIMIAARSYGSDRDKQYHYKTARSAFSAIMRENNWSILENNKIDFSLIINMQDGFGQTLFHHVVILFFNEINILCLNSILFYNQNDINIFAHDENYTWKIKNFKKIFHILSNNNLNLDVQDLDGYSALEYLYFFCGKQVMIWLNHEKEFNFKTFFLNNLKKIFLEQESLLSARYLYLTVKCENVFLLKTLMNFNINVNQADKFGRTPLHLACDCKNLNILRMLLEHGSDPNIKSKNGLTPLLEVLHTGPLDALNILISNEKKFMGVYVNIYVKDNERNTVLHLAVRRGSIETIKSLLKIYQQSRGSVYFDSQHFKNIHGHTPLHEVIVYHQPLKVFQVLFEAGFNLEVLDDNGEKFLDFALKRKRIDIMKFIISNNLRKNKPINYLQQ